MKRYCMVTACLLLGTMLVIGGCKTTTETVTKTTTQPASTVTATVSQPASTVTNTVTQPASTVTVTSTAQPSTSTTKTTTTTATSTTKTTTTTSATSTATATTQPQTITSDDGKLQIIKHQSVADPYFGLTVSGTVKNISSATVSAEVKVEYYESGSLVDTQTATFDDIPAGGVRAFTLTSRAPDFPQYCSYVVSVKSI